MTEPKEEETITFGGIVADLRKQRKLSQSRLAEMAQVSRNTISMIERNKVIPGIATFCRLSNALGMPLGDLLSAYQRAQEV